MMGEFLLWLSGVDREVLARCPSERNKFIGIGGTVLTTAVIATAACTLTVGSFVHAPWPVATIVGLGWGLAIMNLDRWLVSSTKRQGSTVRTLLMAVPRILLAIIIGLVIAEPLVLQVFRSEVGLAAAEIQIDRLQAVEKKLTAAESAQKAASEKVDKVQSQLDSVGTSEAVDATKPVQDRIALRDKAEKKLENAKTEEDRIAARDELNQANRNLVLVQVDQKNQLAGSVDKTKERLAASLERARKSLKTKTDRTDQLNATVDSLRGEPGLLDRMQGLERLTSTNASLNVSQWVLRLFILALDSLPVLVKTLMMLGKPSLYDMTLEELENERLSEIQARTAANKKAATIEAQVLVQEAEDRHDLELAAARELAFDIVEAQKELARDYIAAWKVEASRQMQEEIQNGVHVDLTTPPAPSGSTGGLGGRAAGPNGPYGGGRGGPGLFGNGAGSGGSSTF